jgi:predicted ATP-dependent endonuclease of OLD family
VLLTSLQLEGFRSVAGEITLHINEALTCLVGANEHGKTNLLEALNLMDTGSFDPFDKYVKSKDEDDPRLSYFVRISEPERRSLIHALEEQLATFLARPDAAEHPKAESRYKSALGHLKKTSSSPDIRIHLFHDNSRMIQVGSNYFVLSASPLKKWFDESGPTVSLFEPSANLADSITLVELQAKKNPPFVGLLKLAGAWDDIELLFTADNAAHRRLQNAGKTLTRRLRKIWSQGAAHTFRFDESGGRLHLGIEDPTTYDMPSRRSLGFQSFFSFYLSVYAETDDFEPEGFILLFDEPGIHLHPRGQKDLLRELRKLSKRNQIIYTTHSPFMIDRNSPLSTVLVEKGMKGSTKGTRIVSKPYGENWGPLNRALGITPADGFFPSDRVLLVEGRSDRLYVHYYMGLCQTATQADLNELSVVDADRREEVEDYLKLLLASDRRVVVLADGDQGGDDLNKRIRRVAGQKKERVSFIDLRKIIAVKKSVSFEDALPVEDWLSAVQQYVTKVLDSKQLINHERILDLAKTRSLGKAAGEYLTEAKIITSSKQFSKTTVADFFCRNKLPQPSASSPLGQLCAEITSALGIHL